MFFAENSVKNDILTFRFIVSWKLGLVQVRIPSTIFTSVFNPFKRKKCLFIWLYWVLFAVQYLLLCIWDLAPWPGVEPQIPSLGMRVLATGPSGKSPAYLFLSPITYILSSKNMRNIIMFTGSLLHLLEMGQPSDSQVLKIFPNTFPWSFFLWKPQSHVEILRD